MTSNICNWSVGKLLVRYSTHLPQVPFPVKARFPPCIYRDAWLHFNTKNARLISAKIDPVFCLTCYHTFTIVKP